MPPDLASSPVKSRAVCDARCFAERKVYIKELQKWSRSTLLLVGLEHATQRFAGANYWDAFDKSIKVSISSPEDFDIKGKDSKCCWCGGDRLGGSTSDQEALNSKPLEFGRNKSVCHTLINSVTAMGLEYPPMTPDSSASTSSFVGTSTTGARAMCERSTSESPLSLCSTNSCHSSRKEKMPSIMDRMFPGRNAHSHITDSTNSNVYSSSGGAEDDYQCRMTALMRLFPGMPTLHNPALFTMPDPWAGSSAIFPPNLPRSQTDGSMHATFQDKYDENNMMQKLSQWQTQLMAMNLFTNQLFGTPSHEFPSGSLSSIDSKFAAEEICRQTLSSVSRENAIEDEEDKPLDLSCTTGSVGNGNLNHPANLEHTTHKKSNLENKMTNGLPESVDGEVNAKKKWSLQKSLPYLNHRALFLHEKNAVDDSLNTKLQLIGTKRNYSQADLDAAVLDIRMGRLGTRRASVVYGIPRSTLRNKIYKLEAAEDNGDGSSKRRRLTAYALRKKERANHYRKGNRMPSLTSDLNSNSQPNPIPFGSTAMNITADCERDIDLNSSNDAELEMPPVKRSRSSAKLSSATLSDLANAAASLPTLNNFSEMLRQYVDGVEKEDSMHGAEGTSVTPPTEHNSGDEIGGTDSLSSKRVRPKRGQYRKYDKGALEKAVAAVRSGQMSVHRAGSFYGVPHSTLEYKVKERNLLRHKNKRAKANAMETELAATSLNNNVAILRQNSREAIDSVVSLMVESLAEDDNDDGRNGTDVSEAAVIGVVSNKRKSPNQLTDQQLET
ncbi:helix-turn-helix, psq domain-containing protein [Ditylenchus destructor]|nr:helix-turn-helix, psq domain-containing protein [Ditylenchus destructor]